MVLQALWALAPKAIEKTTWQADTTFLMSIARHACSTNGPRAATKSRVASFAGTLLTADAAMLG